MGGFLMVGYHKSSAAHTLRSASAGERRNLKRPAHRHRRRMGYRRGPICGTPPWGPRRYPVLCPREV